MDCQKKFEEIYGKPSEGLSFCPYRVCPLGAHVDHQLGKITGFAVDKGIHIAFRPKRNGIVEMVSLQFDKRAQWHVDSVPESPERDWADHLRGANLALARRYSLTVGVCGVIEGSLPIGGLSSSASVIIAFLAALCHVNGLELSDREMIALAMEAENQYVGVSCGKLDQSCEVLSKKDHLLYLDTRNDRYECIPANPNMKPYRIAIFFSGLERSLAGTQYNTRVDECKAAAYSLLAYAGEEYGKFKSTYLRDVPYELYEKYGDRLPEPWRKRAAHWFSESRRVEEGVEAWRRGDIETFGRLCTESGYSSIYNYEAGSDELKKMYEILCETDGVYGGRFSGAGFKGCCMALIDPAYEEAIEEKVEREYLAAFPHLKGKYSAHICRSADGVKLQ